MKFPSIRPPRANYIRPLDGEMLTLSPPGFSWWRAADRGTCQYRVIVTRDGKPYYESHCFPIPYTIQIALLRPELTTGMYRPL